MFFWQFTLRTGSTAKASYQRKHCLTTAVKALSSLPPSFSSSHFFFLIFTFSCFGVWWLSAQPFDTKHMGAVLRRHSADKQYLVSCALVKGDTVGYCYSTDLCVCLPHSRASFTWADRQWKLKQQQQIRGRFYSSTVTHCPLKQEILHQNVVRCVSSIYRK